MSVTDTFTHYDSHRYALLNRWDSSHLDTVDEHLTLNGTDRVLEVGCGRGHLTSELAGRGVDIVGIDANPHAPQLADSDAVLHMQAESLDFADDAFTTIISVHAIEHIPPLDRALAEMARVLVDGGRALFIYPAEPIRGLYAIPTSIILHGTPFKAREVHCHKLWPARLREMAEPHGLVESHSEFNLLKSPQFVSVFKKQTNAASQVTASCPDMVAMND